MTLPSFLHGCLDWRENGYHWNGSPPPDLMSAASLNSKDPWIVVAAVIEHAKQGDHSAARHLVPFFHQHQPMALARVALLAFGDLAPTGSLGALQDVLRSQDGSARPYAAEAAAGSGALFLVPAMTEAWTQARSLADHETIGYAITELLESDGGPLSEHVGLYDLSSSDTPAPTPAMQRLQEKRRAMEAELGPAEFPSLVATAHAKLAEELGTDAFVWQGAPVDVGRLVGDFLQATRNVEHLGFIGLRHRFEAWTGQACQRFFHAFEAQRLEMAATLEDFERADAAAPYVVGRRHFFGHRVPDT